MLTPTPKLQKVSLALLRMLLAAWIGAAVLFVITSVAEQTSPQFDSRVRDQLAAIRFPYYYDFGFVVHGIALPLALVVRRCQSWQNPKVLTVATVLIAASLTGILLDYFLVFQPLMESITPAGKVRTPEFTRLHNLSRQANQVHLTLLFLAAILTSLPVAGKSLSESES